LAWSTISWVKKTLSNMYFKGRKII
jgi:hypothetical protein